MKQIKLVTSFYDTHVNNNKFLKVDTSNASIKTYHQALKYFIKFTREFYPRIKKIIDFDKRIIIK